MDKIKLSKADLSALKSSPPTQSEKASVTSVSLDAGIEEVNLEGTTSEKKELEQQIDSINYSEIKEAGYKAQGVTVIDGEVVITAHKGTKDYSRIYFYDLETGEYNGMIILNNMAHVGGMSYDQVNHILYVTGEERKVNAYEYDEITAARKYFKNKKNTNVLDFNVVDMLSNDSYKISDFVLDSEIQISSGSAASTYFYDGALYISNFKGTKNGALEKYRITYNKRTRKVSAVLEQNYEVPALTQGIAVTDYKGERYLITTQSIGIALSTVTMYRLKEDSLEFVGVKPISQIGLEGIDVDENGNVIACYETGAQETDVWKIGEFIEDVSHITPSEAQLLGTSALSRGLGGIWYDLTH